MRRRSQRPAVPRSGFFHYAMTAAAAMAMTFTGLMVVLFHECSSSGTACGAIETPLCALMSAGPGTVVAGALGWLYAVREARREGDR
jgi:hypothetical protein